jgi:hypothetical protein
MDIHKMISELRTERERIDRVISAIESLGRTDRGGSIKSRAPAKRGRRRMSAAARRKLSQLLKQRWAQGKMKPRRKAA